MIRRLAGPAILAAMVAGAAGAQVLTLPSTATLQEEAAVAGSLHALPAGPWSEGGLPRIEVEGRLIRVAYRLPGAQTVEQVLSPLREQLRGAGYEILFGCRSVQCGGFDFRFAIDVLPPPEMMVSIDDFAYLAASGPEGGHIALLASRSGAAVYLQITQVLTGPDPVQVLLQEILAEAPAVEVAPGGGPSPLDALSPEDFGAALERHGHIALDDLGFAPGASALVGPDPASLATLATWLAADRSRRVALVGHTDAVGTLEANIALSRARAAAVRRVLIEDLAVAPAQVVAEGTGYLAPRASNLSEAGREANRRVEVVLLVPADP